MISGRARRMMEHHLRNKAEGELNLIPMNSHPDSPYRPPSEPVIDAFLREVAASGLRVTLRRSRGADIQAACGQLALRGAA